MRQQDPSASIQEAHARHLAELPFDDVADFEASQRGYLGTVEDLQIRDDAGRVVWDIGSYGFVAGEAPETVHPSLWRV